MMGFTGPSRWRGTSTRNLARAFGHEAPPIASGRLPGPASFPADGRHDRLPPSIHSLGGPGDHDVEGEDTVQADGWRAMTALLSPLAEGQRSMSYVACAKGNIYRNGAWIDDPALLNEFFNGRASTLGPDIVAELYPPYHYERPLPRLFGGRQDLLDHVMTVARNTAGSARCGAGSVLARAADVCVNRSVLYMLTEHETRVVYETHRLIDRNLIPLLADADLRAVDSRFDRDARKLYLWIGSVGSMNYGHWLVDDLARVRAIEAIRRTGEARQVCIVMPDVGQRHNQVYLESLAALCKARGLGEPEVLFIRPDEKAFFEELHFVTPVTQHPVLKSPDAMNWVGDGVFGDALSAEDEARLPARIFVERGVTGNRDLINQAEIGALLRSQGFIGIDTSQMPFQLQANMFRNAEIVIGCMGAAMTNMIFSRPGTLTGYLAPEGWVETFYWDLAAIRGHRYAVCFGSTGDQDLPPWQRNYRVNPASVEEMVRHLRQD